MSLRGAKTLSFQDLMGVEQEIAPGRSKEMDQLRTAVEAKGLIEQILGFPLTINNIKAVAKEFKGSSEGDAWGVDASSGNPTPINAGQALQIQPITTADPVKSALNVLEKLPDDMTVAEIKKQMKGEQ